MSTGRNETRSRNSGFETNLGRHRCCNSPAHCPPSAQLVLAAMSDGASVAKILTPAPANADGNGSRPVPNPSPASARLQDAPLLQRGQNIRKLPSLSRYPRAVNAEPVAKLLISRLL